MATIDERIASLEKKLNEEKEKKKRIDARKRSAETKKRRADDTRRKILIGAIVLARVESGQWPRDKFNTMLETDLIRDDDRDLFDLLPKTMNHENENEDE